MGILRTRVMCNFCLFCIFLLSIFCSPEKAPTTDVKVASGTIERIENFSSDYVNDRHVDVWLPEAYSTNKKYPVIYMHDGQMLFDSTTTWNKQEWQVDETIGDLIKSEQIPPCIIVGIHNTELRHSEYFPEKVFNAIPTEYRQKLQSKGQDGQGQALMSRDAFSDAYLKFIFQELKPHIDRTYSTRPERKNTFMMGSSMGGLISAYALCEYPELLGGVACLSTHWIGAYDTINNPIPATMMDYLEAKLPSPGRHRLYMDLGDQTLDALYPKYQKEVDSLLVALGFTSSSWKTLSFPGSNHSERAWAGRLKIPIRHLLDTQSLGE